jgi:tetratricopeptide (TPR) repeat protein
MIDIDLLWDFDDPVASEARFLSLGAEVQTQLARTHSLRKNFEQAHGLLDNVENDLLPGESRARVRYLLERGRTHHSAGEKERALPLFQQAWNDALRLGEDALAIDAAHMLGIVTVGEESVRWNEEALALAGHSPDPKARRWRGSLYNNLGWTYHDSGRLPEALACFQQALDARREQGQLGPERIARWCVARCLRSLGRFHEALEIQEELRAEHEAAGTRDEYVEEEIAILQAEREKAS